MLFIPGTLAIVVDSGLGLLGRYLRDGQIMQWTQPEGRYGAECECSNPIVL